MVVVVVVVVVVEVVVVVVVKYSQKVGKDHYHPNNNSQMCWR